MYMFEDCYIFIDLSKDVPEELRTFSYLCVECHDVLYPDTGWFWEGSKHGYGPWDYSCARCNKVIHHGEINEEV